MLIIPLLLIAGLADCLLGAYLQRRRPIGANLRDVDPPNGSCDHGLIPVLWSGSRNPKPVAHLSVKMGPVAMTAAQKAL